MDNPLGLLIHETRAFVERAAFYTVGIVNLLGESDTSTRTFSEHIGTGSLCLWHGSPIILTAKHVLSKAASSDLAFLPRVGTSIDWEGTGKTELGSRMELPILDIVRCEWEDLAAIRLAPEVLELQAFHFCKLPDKLALDQTVDAGGVLLVGYPVDQTFAVSRSLSQGNLTELRGCVPVPLMGELVPKPSRSLSSRFDPAQHILIRFDPCLPNSEPFGYSGSGVWCDPRKVGPVWIADPILLGIETAAFRSSGLLLAIRAGVVRRFLEEQLP